MFQPLVSIIIPVYNGSNYLKEAIDSALAQTYKNIEVVVINDGSNDNGATEAIAKSYGNKIRYFSKPNGGVSTALNLGIKKMRGEYFSWLSHDDLYYPNKVERQIEFISKLKDRAVMIFADFEVLYNDTGKKESVILDDQMLKDKPKYSVARCCINGITVLLPRQIIKQVGEFNKNLRSTQDYDYWMRVQNKFPAIHMNEILTVTRIHPDQDSRKVIANNEADQLWLRIIDWLPNKDMIEYEGSRYVFFQETLRFLKPTNYQNTKQACEKNIAKEKKKIITALKKLDQKDIIRVLDYLETNLNVCLDKQTVIEKENALLFERVGSVNAENQRLLAINEELSRSKIKFFLKKIISKIRGNH